LGRVVACKSGYRASTPNKEPNPNRIRRQKTPDSPPSPEHGARLSPDDDPDWIAVGHAEAEAQRRTGDAVPPTHATGAGGGKPNKPRADG
jgi:hypothetical protein